MATWEDSTAPLGARPGASGGNKRDRETDWMEDSGDVPQEEKKEEDAQVKPKKKRNIFSDEHLRGSKGFPLIYSTFPVHFGRAVTHGNEAEALRDLIAGYKEWAYELFPNLNFEDLVDRTENLAKKAVVTSLIAEMRQKEKKRGEPEEEELPPMTASEQWDDMKEYEEALRLEQEKNRTKRDYSDDEVEFNLPVSAPSTKKTAQVDASDGEAEFTVPTSSMKSNVVDDEDSEAEFEFAPTTKAQEKKIDDDSEEEFEFAPPSKAESTKNADGNEAANEESEDRAHPEVIQDGEEVGDGNGKTNPQEENEEADQDDAEAVQNHQLHDEETQLPEGIQDREDANQAEDVNDKENSVDKSGEAVQDRSDEQNELREDEETQLLE